MTPAIIVATASTDRERWMAERGGHTVTASQVHRIARGSKRTWRAIVDDKLNGAKFKGNAHTERGHEREPFLLAAASVFTGDVFDATGHLFAAADDQRFRATPDAVAFAEDYGVEAKSHIHGTDVSKIPTDHFDQMQWGMRVLGYSRWLYVTEVLGEDGEPTLDDPVFRWVPRDEGRIAELEEVAIQFLDWWDAGCPMGDTDLPDNFEAVVGAWLAADAQAKAAAAVAKTHEKHVRALIAARTGADTAGWKPSSPVGGFTYSVTPRVVLDEDAWKTAEPDSHARVQDLKQRAAMAEAAATVLYAKTTTQTRLLPVHPKGEDSE